MSSVLPLQLQLQQHLESLLGFKLALFIRVLLFGDELDVDDDEMEEDKSVEDFFFFFG